MRVRSRSSISPKGTSTVMASRSSSKSSARFVRVLVVSALAVAASVAYHSDGADACGGWGPSIVELTLFDPHVITESGDGLAYDPFDAVPTLGDHVRVEQRQL